MRLTIATAGSRGDVQPYVALGQGLRAAGHEVTLAADASFEAFVREHRLAFAPLHRDPREPLGAEIERMGRNPLAMLRWLKDHYTPDRQYFVDLLAACEDSEAVLVAALAFPALHVAEALRIPWLAALLQPWTPSREVSWSLPVDLPRWLPKPVRGEVNWWSGRMASLLYLNAMRAAVDDGRQEVLGLPPAPLGHHAVFGQSDMPAVYGFSRHVVPVPNTWGSQHAVTGFWYLSQNGWRPPPKLLAFLDEGPPPVAIGFGSMIDAEAEKATGMVLDALARTGQRGLLLGGWAQLGAAALPDTVFQLDEAPHGWLFPQVSAVVHHGGAGATAAALLAGVPAVTVPFFADQPFWGSRVHALGAGAKPIPRRQLTAGRLAQRLRHVLQPQVATRAANVGALLREEDGVATAVAAIEKLL
jgi:sterol 3beta-glucosyltransferase